MASCPAYAGPICSLCCSLDARCHDLCKPHARIERAGRRRRSARCCRQPIYARINSQLGHYLGVFAVSAGLVGLTLGADLSADLGDDAAPTICSCPTCCGRCSSRSPSSSAWWPGCSCWRSRAAARRKRKPAADHAADPGNRRAQAHRRRTAARQGSRRSRQPRQEPLRRRPQPRTALAAQRHQRLCAVAGTGFQRCSTKPRDQVRVVRRSADHLSGLIDGILDISKIEAGRLYLSRDEVRLSEFLDQLVGMFRLQAAAKGIEFVFKRPAVLPVVVYADEKRLRQILINLLSNAIKFTQTRQRAVRRALPQPGRRVRGRSTPAPASRPATSNASSRRSSAARSACRSRRPAPASASPSAELLAGVMGGDIRVTSTVGNGSTFRVKTAAVRSHQPDADRAGRCADLRLSRPAQDDPDHRRRSDPARSAARGADAARLHPAQRAGRPGLPRAGAALPAGSVPARYLDAGMDGWTVAETLRDERPSPGAHPDGVGERAGSARRAAGAAVPRRLSDEADRYSAGCWN